MRIRPPGRRRCPGVGRFSGERPEREGARRRPCRAPRQPATEGLKIRSETGLARCEKNGLLKAEDAPSRSEQRLGTLLRPVAAEDDALQAGAEADDGSERL